MRITLLLALALCQLPSVVKDLHFSHLLPTGASPLQVERCTGLEPYSDKTSCSNKKPGVERRANPPIAWAACCGRWGGCTRSSISCYPVLVTNLTSGLTAGRLGIRTKPQTAGHHRHQESIAIFSRSSSVSELFLLAHLWNSPPIVEKDETL
jgi:hypothetical protein